MNPFLLRMTEEINEAIALHSPVLNGNDLYERITFFLQEYIPCMQECDDENPGLYLRILFQNAKELDPSLIEEDPYVKNISFSKGKEGNILLTNTFYQPYELLQYGMPLLYEDMVIPKLGYFKRKVSFPAVYEGNVPWMSVCPSEIASMKEGVEKAHGKMLVLGLGLGYMQYLSALKEEVSSIDIVEINPAVIDLFEKHVHPQMKEAGKKMHVIYDDAMHYLNSSNLHAYDSVFVDVYEGQEDGHAWYEKILPYEKAYPGITFTYWIEEYIR